jgi:hypothetical protein
MTLSAASYLGARRGLSSTVRYCGFAPLRRVIPFVWNPKRQTAFESLELMCGLLGTRIMAAADEYRDYAQECLRWADETDNQEHRQAFLEMAKIWTQLAMHRNEMGTQKRVLS